MKRDFNAGNLVIGGIASGVVRDIDATFAPRLARHAEMLGNDVQYTFGDRTYSVSANVALTNVSGDPREILLRQESSARYFQRPDRGAGSNGILSNRLDSTATSMRGVGAYARISKDAGDVFGELQVSTRSPGYETNDYAFQQRADYTSFIGNVGRVWTKPTSWYRNIAALAGGQLQSNYEGDRTWAQLHQYVSETTNAFWNLSLFHIYRARAMDDRQLRGGPVVAVPSNHYVSANVNTDSRHAWVGGANVSYFWNALGGASPSISLNANYRPAPNLTLSFGPSWSRTRGGQQFVQSIVDETATAFYGTRYVLADLDQRTLGLDTRVSMTFSPTMTLELYVQPFFAAGRYARFEEYASPRTTRLSVYGRDRGTIAAVRDTTDAVVAYTIDPDGVGAAKAFLIANPDFTQQSLRGNAVFRWEYRPGSVLYVAWTQSRSGEQAFGDLDFQRDRTALLAARPDNVLLVKASWWLPR
jgi:hypothetical protein